MIPRYCQKYDEDTGEVTHLKLEAVQLVNKKYYNDWFWFLVNMFLIRFYFQSLGVIHYYFLNQSARESRLIFGCGIVSIVKDISIMDDSKKA